MMSPTNPYCGDGIADARTAISDINSALVTAPYSDSLPTETLAAITSILQDLERAATQIAAPELLSAVASLEHSVGSSRRYAISSGCEAVEWLIRKLALESHPLMAQARANAHYVAAVDAIDAAVRSNRAEREAELSDFTFATWPDPFEEQDSIRIVYHIGIVELHSPCEMRELVRSVLNNLNDSHRLLSGALVADTIDDVGHGFESRFRESILDHLLWSFAKASFHHYSSYCPTPSGCPNFEITVDIKKSAIALAISGVIGAVVGGEIGGYEIVPVIKGVIGAEAAAITAMIVSLLKQSPEIQDTLTHFDYPLGWPTLLANQRHAAVMFALHANPRTVTEITRDLHMSCDDVDSAIDYLEANKIVESGDSERWRLTLPIPQLLFLAGRDEDGRCKVEQRVLFEFTKHVVRRSLRTAFGSSPPQKEDDVQKALSTIVAASGLEFSRETPEFRFSLKRFRPDFSHEPCRIAIEVKLIRSRTQSKRVVEEIAADVTSYKSRFKWILFVVYDLGIIENEWEFCQPFRSTMHEHEHEVDVLVIKH